MLLECPACSSTSIKKNGHIHNGKQNHQCLACGRQFVLDPQQKIINEEKRSLIRQALLERVSLEGVCRIFNVSMPWLLQFINEIIKELPGDLNATVTCADELEVAFVELDEQWSYVKKKDNQQWLWLVFHSKTRQVLAMHVGKRTRQAAECLLEKLPEGLKKKAIFYTDKFSVYYETIPWLQHRPVGKESGKTSYIERFNNTLRQRCSRLVRKTLSFSKKLANHIGMLKYFICDYNQRRALHL
ncbi:IS1 family transposase [Candidatus Protochlamydia naegleriophila]|uniref:IS1 family transposase n=1 Tax=Candidatus Protochlamydia naegleriophila TaxID=389348 RepID=UPI0018D4C802|nr:IS1 family transposase [Candidatus Protochlamydia naegleriophila]